MKKISLINISIITGLFFCTAVILTFMSSCKVSQKVAAKTGAQLWAENCQRCHNTPSPSTFSAEQWETVGMHMQSRALLTDDERDKIVGFLKQ
ncbi:MAG TPA: cytochrome c [Puia sp.]|nr:cytochrome c [Puia sp.]